MSDDPNQEIEIPDWLRRPATPQAGSQPAPAPGGADSGLEPAEIPDWVRGMQPGASPPPEPVPEPAGPPPIAGFAPELIEEELSPAEVSLLDDLREHAVDSEPDEPEGTAISRLFDRLRGRGGDSGPGLAERLPPNSPLAPILRLAPWQRFVLALLLFLNTLLLGCMCLIMTSRIVPFQ
ncbi:MAG: hypothetical protein JW900_13515 [Anaerolineae bacterium]|nr:hypothetical protein [Anaerolineae bacterium]